MSEIAAIAEHMASLTLAAAAFQLEPDVPGEPEPAYPPTVGLLDEDSEPEAAETLGEIRAWSAGALAADRAPNIWRAFANHARHLEAVWGKNRLILGAGILDEFTKNCAALAVAQFRQSRSWIAYQTQFLRQSFGIDDRGIVETTAMAMHALSFNTVAHGMRLPAYAEDMSAQDFKEGGRLDGVDIVAAPTPED